MSRHVVLLVSTLFLSLACFGCGTAEDTDMVAWRPETEESTQEVSERSAGELSEESAGEVSEESAQGAPTTAEEEGEVVSFEGVGAPMGGLVDMDSEPLDIEDLSETEREEVESASINDDQYEGISLRVDSSRSFYYYSKLDGYEKALYDAFLKVAENPTTSDYYVSVICETDSAVEGDEARLKKVRSAVLYDHPELFWIYGSDDYDFAIRRDTRAAGAYYLCLNSPYQNYENEMTAFNKAVDEFLGDIDLTQSKDRIALQIHDKLCDMVSYDYDAAAAKSSDNYAHTAYGALVANSSGEPHRAVCDGYSLAYEYLLQKAGINSCVIVGKAGDSEQDMGGHAWNVIELGGDWYEVDSTWDDNNRPDSWYESLRAWELEASTSDERYTYRLIREALTDERYTYNVSRYLCFLTSAAIENYRVADWPSLAYQAKDGSTIALASDSVHYRACNEKIADTYSSLDDLVELAPRAWGTYYRIIG